MRGILLLLLAHSHIRMNRQPCLTVKENGEGTGKEHVFVSKNHKTVKIDFQMAIYLYLCRLYI